MDFKRKHLHWDLCRCSWPSKSLIFLVSSGVYLCSPPDFINEGFEDHEAESSNVTPLSHGSVWCASPHFTPILRNSELQPCSCGKDPFESSQSLQPRPQAVRKPRSCRHLLVTNGAAAAADESRGAWERVNIRPLNILQRASDSVFNRWI